MPIVMRFTITRSAARRGFGRATNATADPAWNQATAKKNAPKTQYSSKCVEISAKWIAAAPAEKAATCQRRKEPSGSFTPPP
jgi:hypothetical protein